MKKKSERTNDRTLFIKSKKKVALKKFEEEQPEKKEGKKEFKEGMRHLLSVVQRNRVRRELKIMCSFCYHKYD